MNAVRFRRPDSFSIVACAQVLRPVRSSVQSPGFRCKGPPRTIGGIGMKVHGRPEIQRSPDCVSHIEPHKAIR